MLAVGFEPHPVFARIARGKFPSTDTLQQLDNIETVIEEGLLKPKTIDLLSPASVKFLTKLFPMETLEVLIGARESLRENNLFNNDLAFLMLSKIVDMCSHSQTDGIYKAPTSRKNSVIPLKAWNKVVQTIRSDLIEMQPYSYSRLGRIYEKSSETMSEVHNDSADIVVTSPPYLNNFDFAEMTRMYLYFWGIASSWGDITDKVRSKLIVNTTTALKGHKEKQEEYRCNIPSSLHPYLDELVKELAIRRTTKAGKKEYDYLIYPYFSQMTNVLRECFRCMKAEAPIHVMVADAALYGVHISTPQYLREILKEIGFSKLTCSLVRKRGHRWNLKKREGSTIGLGEYHVQGIKRS